MPLRYTAEADKHHVPHKSTWRVVLTARSEPTVTNWGEPGLLYVGIDDRGVELEVITVNRHGDEIAVHSMPTSYRHDTRN